MLRVGEPDVLCTGLVDSLDSHSLDRRVCFQRGLARHNLAILDEVRQQSETKGVHQMG